MDEYPSSVFSLELTYGHGTVYGFFYYCLSCCVWGLPGKILCCLDGWSHLPIGRARGLALGKNE